jgi:predicted nucleic acid-binding protein
VSHRVVFDTNVILSGIVFGGKPADCLNAARVESIAGLTCEGILLEVEEKLAVKFKYSEAAVEELILDLARSLHIIEVPGDLHGRTSTPMMT